jgi:hypothetical protein
MEKKIALIANGKYPHKKVLAEELELFKRKFDEFVQKVLFHLYLPVRLRKWTNCSKLPFLQFHLLESPFQSVENVVDTCI